MVLGLLFELRNDLFQDDAEEKVKSISKKDPFLRRIELLKSLAEVS
jgi:hypothetical protein